MRKLLQGMLISDGEDLNAKIRKISKKNHFYNQNFFLYIAWTCFRNDRHVFAGKGIELATFGSLCEYATHLTVEAGLTNKELLIFLSLTRHFSLHSEGYWPIL